MKEVRGVEENQKSHAVDALCEAATSLMRFLSNSDVCKVTYGVPEENAQYVVQIKKTSLNVINRLKEL